MVMDVRYVVPRRPVPWRTQKREPRQRLWMKACSPLSDETYHHHCVAAYASDFALVSTAAFPAGFPNTDITMVVSIDHSLWFQYVVERE